MLCRGFMGCMMMMKGRERLSRHSCYFYLRSSSRFKHTARTHTPNLGVCTHLVVLVFSCRLVALTSTSSAACTHSNACTRTRVHMPGRLFRRKNPRPGAAAACIRCRRSTLYHGRQHAARLQHAQVVCLLLVCLPPAKRQAPRVEVFLCLGCVCYLASVCPCMMIVGYARIC